MELRSAETLRLAPSFQCFNKLLKVPGCTEQTVQSQESSSDDDDDDDDSLRATNQKRSNDRVFGPGKQWAQPSAPGHQSDTQLPPLISAGPLGMRRLMRPVELAALLITSIHLHTHHNISSKNN